MDVETLKARVEAEKKNAESPYYRGCDPLASLAEWRLRQAREG